MKLGEIHTDFPNGVVLIADEGSSEPIPSWGSEEDQVTAARTAAVLRVRHADEGSVAMRIWDDDTAVAGVAAFDGRLEIPSGNIKISDALGALWLTVGVQGGSCRLRVFVNSAVEADQLDLVIEP